MQEVVGETLDSGGYEGADEFMLESVEDHEAIEAARNEAGHLDLARDMAADTFQSFGSANPAEGGSQQAEEVPAASAAALASAARVAAALPSAVLNPNNPLAPAVATDMPRSG